MIKEIRLAKMNQKIKRNQYKKDEYWKNINNEVENIDDGKNRKLKEFLK